MNKMQIMTSSNEFLIPSDVAEILRCDPELIRVSARDNKLPFPFIRIGSRTKIPRTPFVKFMGWEE